MFIHSASKTCTWLGLLVNITVFWFKGSLTVWAIYAYFSDSQNAAFELLVWCIKYQCNRCI